MRLYDLESPEQIQYLSLDQLKELCDDIRYFLIDSLSKTGGQLASNLSIVDATVAMHYVFHVPQDRVLFDVGYQCLTHKILTGQSTRFATLNRFEGLDPYCDPHTSRFDTWKATHAGQSLSIASGLASARDLSNETYQVLCVIGDEALHAGASLEALERIGERKQKVILIYNDNQYSDAQNHHLQQALSNLRSTKLFRQAGNGMKSSLASNRLGKSVLHTFGSVKDSIKESVSKQSLFDVLNFHTIGPIDGHNLEDLIAAFQHAKECEGPVVVHLHTQKGYGSRFADQQADWNPLVPFNKETGKPLFLLPKSQITWSEYVEMLLIEQAKDDGKLVVISSKQSSFKHFAHCYPKRTFIFPCSDQHCISFACGFAAEGYHPFVAMPSAYILKSLDAIQANLAYMNLPIVLGISDIGLNGQAGSIFHGIDDLLHLETIPNLVLATAKDAKEFKDLFYTAFQSNQPFVLRYPNQSTSFDLESEANIIELGSWSQFQIGMQPKSIVFCYGDTVDRLLAKAKENNLEMIIVNARFFKPIDTKILRELFALHLPIHICETDRRGSLARAIEAELSHCSVLGIDDHFVGQGSVRTLRICEHISIESFLKDILSDAD